MILPVSLKNLSRLSAQSEQKISEIFTSEELPKGHLLFQAGEICRHIYFIERGLARIYAIQGNGKDITSWFFPENSFFTAHDSFYRRSPANNNCELLEESVVCSLRYTDLEVMLNENHDMAKFAFHALFELTRLHVEFMNGFKFQRAEDRYNALMHYYPNIFQRAKLGHIASFLGITQETLSRIRAGK